MSVLQNLIAGFEFALQRLVKPDIVDGDRSLSGDGGHQPLGALGEHAGLRMAKEESAQHLAASRHYRHGEIAAHRQMALGHAEMGCALAVAWIGQNIRRADDGCPAKGCLEHRGIARHGELLERGARGTR